MGSVTINGSTSGSVTIAAPAVAGSTTLTLPSTTSNVLTSVNSVAAVTGTPSASNYLRGDGTWAAVSASGQLIRAPQILTSGTSYTTPSNCTAIYVEAVGGGGGGGNGTNNVGGAGGGAYCAKYFTVTGSTAYTYAIGSGGASINTSSANGNSGGNTTFTVGATTITAGGGSGGTQAAGGSPVAIAGGSGGTATNGDINIPGGDGQASYNNGTANFSVNGSGGNSIWGIGGAGQIRPNAANPSTTGTSGKNYGGGGSGAFNGNATGAGAQGVIRIWEYT